MSIESDSSETIEWRPKGHLYLIAIRATSMESQHEIGEWLRQRGAVVVMAHVWLLRGQYRFAGDIQRELERFRDLDGQLLVVGLHQATDRTCKGLSEEVSSWISKNLNP